MKAYYYLTFVLFISTITHTNNSFSHERNVVGGMSILFGGEPEPMLNDERQFLRWRFTDVRTDEPVINLEELQATIKFDGSMSEPFTVRGSFRDPGMYQSNHIFTKAGAGEVTLSFKKEGDDKMLSITFPFKVDSRDKYEIP